MRYLTSGIHALAALLVLALLGGCSSGGTNSGTGGNTVGKSTTQFGSLSVTSSGALQPAVTSGGSGTEVTGLAGAITNVTLALPSATPVNGPALLKTTKIAFIRNGQLFLMDADGGNQIQVTSGAACSDVAWFPDGTRLAVIRVDAATGFKQIYTINTDGTGQTRLTDGTHRIDSVSVSHDGTKIAFAQLMTPAGASGLVYELFTMPATGGAATQVTFDGGIDGQPSWSPDGARLAFSQTIITDPNTGANTTGIQIMDANGANRHALLADTVKITGAAAPDWSPIGNTVAFISVHSGGTDIVLAEVQNTPVDTVKVVLNGTTDWDEPSWSPDLSHLAIVGPGPDKGTGTLWSLPAIGGSPTQLTPSQAGVGDIAPAWSPLFTKRTLVGKDGTLGTEAVGFLFGQKSTVVTSFLAFSTATPVSAQIATTTGINAGLTTYVFTIAVPVKLTRLAYLNDLYTLPTQVIGDAASSTCSGAVVSFDALTGRVALVIPYTLLRSVNSRPSATVNGDTVTVHGAFLGVWDAAGSNHAPQGTSEVRLDRVTGALLAVQ